MAGNVDTGGQAPNCVGTITNNGYNLDSGTTCGWGFVTGSMSSTDPLIGPLANNGGLTLLHRLNPGSPAIDMGNIAGCTDSSGTPLSIDQRGVLRPINGDAVPGARCDIGAYEAFPAVYLPLILR